MLPAQGKGHTVILVVKLVRAPVVVNIGQPSVIVWSVWQQFIF